MSTSTFRKRSTLTAGAASLIVSSIFGSPSQAAIINGSFETGDFSQWNTIGNTSIQTSAYGSGPTAGTYDALLSTGEATPVPVNSLEDFVGLLPGSLNGIGDGDTFQGSAIKQTFNANAGQVLTFDWDFLTNEATPSQFFNDFSFVNISSASNITLSKLADTSSAFTSSPTRNYTDTNKSFASETGFQTFSYTIPTTGEYSLGIGATNAGDPYGVSGVLIDNVKLSSTPVPEPGLEWGVFALGALGIGSALKRRFTLPH